MCYTLHFINRLSYIYYSKNLSFMVKLRWCVTIYTFSPFHDYFISSPMCQVPVTLPVPYIQSFRSGEGPRAQGAQGQEIRPSWSLGGDTWDLCRAHALVQGTVYIQRRTYRAKHYIFIHAQARSFDSLSRRYLLNYHILFLNNMSAYVRPPSGKWAVELLSSNI